MATDLIMPTLPNQQQPAYYHHERPNHQRAQSYHSSFPPASPLSSSNASPTSPKSYHARRVQPMYMPAVLRPTEFPSKEPRQCSKPVAEGEDEPSLRRSSSGLMGLTGLALFGARLGRRSTADSAKCFGAEWDLDMFPQVTAEPTRKHWKVRCDKDSSVARDSVQRDLSPETASFSVPQ